jgi:uncharacterized membrane protein (DUF373 family)
VTGPPDARPEAEVPYTGVHRLVRRLIEPAQDALVALLAVALLALMARGLFTLALHAVSPSFSVRDVLAEALFVLLMVELQRLVIIYLRDHHVSVDVMVEATIVAALREVQLRGALDLPPLELLALTAFVLGLGLLLRFGDLRAPRPRVRNHGRGLRAATPHGTSSPPPEGRAAPPRTAT